ncbi:hypothetical protein [Microvirga solisilvae]|nr:hypothetical protein [Microvirga solisilvae]
MSLINLSAVQNAQHSQEPYDHLLASGFLKEEVIEELRRDFLKSISLAT